MKRLLALILCVLMTASLLAGCGGSKDKDVEGTDGADKTSEDVKGNDDKKPITFTMYTSSEADIYGNFDSPVAQKIKELTGVTLDIETAVGDPKQKLSLMASSGEYPDLVFAQEYINILYDAGALIKLDDMIEQYGPNIKKFYGQYMKRHRYSTEDPHVYYLGTYPVESDPTDILGGFGLQHAVVKELGFPKLVTVNDYEYAIKTYMEKYPTIDGQPTIGLSLIADDWRIWISAINPGMYATEATPGSGDCVVADVNDPEFKQTEHFFRPDEREYFRWLNHMYITGLLEPDSFVQKYDQYIAKLSSGRVLAITDDTWEFEEAQLALRRDGKEDRMYGLYPIVLKEGLKNSRMGDIGYSPNSGVAITKSCKDPERALKFLDWMTTEEAQILFWWGIEDVHYKVVDGKRVIPPEEMQKKLTDPDYSKKTGVGVFGYPFPYHGDTAVDSTGQSFTGKTKEDIIKNYPDVAKEVLKAYGADLWKDLFPSANDLPKPPWGAGWTITPPTDSDISVMQKKIDELQFKYVPRIVMAKPGEYDALYDEFLREMEKAGAREIEKAMAKLYVEKVKLWTE